MRLSAKKDISEISKQILQAVSRVETDAAEALDALEHDVSLRDEIKSARRAAVIDGVADAYARIRRDFAPKIDAVTSDLRKLAATLKPAQTANAAVASILSVLEIAPAVNQMMIESAAANIGGDAFGQNCLMQIAQRHGLTLPHMAPIDKHLTESDVLALADDVMNTFRSFFDARTQFDDGSPIDIHNDPEARAQAINRGLRSNTAYTIEHIGDLFDFGGDSRLASEFAAAEESGGI